MRRSCRRSAGTGALFAFVAIHPDGRFLLLPPGRAPRLARETRPRPMIR
jgi:hypothetical protein